MKKSVDAECSQKSSDDSAEKAGLLVSLQIFQQKTQKKHEEIDQYRKRDPGMYISGF